MSTLIKRVLVNGGYTSAVPKNVQFNAAAGGGGARVIFEVEQTSSTDIAQLAEKYRLLVCHLSCPCIHNRTVSLRPTVRQRR